MNSKIFNVSSFYMLTLATLNFLVAVDYVLLLPLIPFISANSQLPIGYGGYLVGSYAIAAVVGVFIFAPFADRWGRRRVLVFQAIGFLVATLGFAFSNTVPEFFISRSIMGFFSGTIGSNVTAYAIDIFVAKQRVRAIGYVQLGFSLSLTLGPPLGLLLTDFLSWNAVFLIVSFLTLLGIGVLQKMPNIQTGAENGQVLVQFKEFFQLLKNRQIQKILVLVAFMMLGVNAFYIYYYQWLVLNLHMPASLLGICVMQGGIGHIVGNRVSVFLQLRGYKKSLIAIGCSFLIAGFWLGWSAILPLKFYGLVFALMMFGGGLRMPAFQNILSDIGPVDLRGRLYALVQIFFKIMLTAGVLWSTPLIHVVNQEIVGMQTVVIVSTLLLLAAIFWLKVIKY